MKTEQDWVKEWREDSSLNRWRYDELELEKRIKQIQLDAQKHGEQIGWKRGMSEAATMMEKGLQTENSGVKYWGNISELKTHEAILTARDNKKEIIP